MKPIKIVKICVDVLMYMMFLLLMGQHLTSGAIHEWMGAGLFVCFFVHNLLNWRWYKALFKGRYTIQRIIKTMVNFLLLVSFAACMMSAFMISGTVFRNFRIPGMMMTGRKLHMVSSAWCFVLMSVHLGLHLSNPKRKVQQILLCVGAAAASAVGIYHFLIRRFYEELFLLTEFKWFDYDKSMIGYLFETTCISIALMTLTYITKRVIFTMRRHRE